MSRTSALIAALGLGLILAFQIAGLRSPLTDAHAWRQTDTASIARNFYRNGYQLLYPQIDWRGNTAGYVESEFPLMPFLTATLYGLFGPHDFLGRVVSIAFATGACCLVFLLARWYFGERTGWLAVLGLAASPLWLFYTESFMPEAAMLFFSLALLYAFARWLDSGGRHWYVSALAAGSLAFLVKIPTLYLAIPLATLSLHRYQMRAFRMKALWAFAILVLVPSVLWYWHADNLRRLTGLSFNIWGIGADKWGTAGIWNDPAFYNLMLSRFTQDITAPLGLLAACLGLLIPARSQREKEGHWLLLSWLGGVLLFIFTIARGNMIHDYYQLPIVPILAIGVGRLLNRLLLALERWTPKAIGGKPVAAIGTLLVTVLWLVLAVAPAWQYADFRYRSLPAQGNNILFETGRDAQARIPVNDLILVAYDDVRLPELLYYVDRRGWLFDLARCNIADASSKVPLGAKWLLIATTRSEAEVVGSSACGVKLAGQFPVQAVASHWILYKLN